MAGAQLDPLARPHNIAAARAQARAEVWAAGAAPDEVIVDIDGTLLDAHSDKQDATPTYKRGFGF